MTAAFQPEQEDAATRRWHCTLEDCAEQLAREEDMQTPGDPRVSAQDIRDGTLLAAAPTLAAETARLRDELDRANQELEATREHLGDLIEKNARLRAALEEIALWLIGDDTRTTTQLLHHLGMAGEEIRASRAATRAEGS